MVVNIYIYISLKAFRTKHSLGKFPTPWEIHERPATPQQRICTSDSPWWWSQMTAASAWNAPAPQGVGPEDVRKGKRFAVYFEGNKKHQKNKGKSWNPTPVSSFKLYQLNWIIPLEFSCKVSPNGMKPFWGGLLGDPFLWMRFMRGESVQGTTLF